MLLTNFCKATVVRCSPLAYTAVEAAAAAAVNSAYAPTLAALPSSLLPYPIKLSHKTVEALATYYMSPASPKLGITVAAAGMPPVGGLRMAPNPATGRMEVLPFLNNDASVADVMVDTETEISCHRTITGASSLLNGVHGIFSRAAASASSPPGAIVTVAPLSIRAATLVLAERCVDQQPASELPPSIQAVDDAAALHALGTSLSTAERIVNNTENIENLEDFTSSLRMSAIESCTPLWRTLLLNERDPDLNFIAWNGGAYA